MAAARDALDALAATPVETFVKASDLPVCPAAARRCLAREAADPRGMVLRVGHGLYWRARLRDRPFTASVGPYRGVAQTKVEPSAAQIADLYSGPGTGITGIEALRKYGMTQQISSELWLAVVGRAPRPPAGRRIKLVGRGNERRKELSYEEVTLLEAIRSYPETRQVQPWNRATVCAASMSRRSQEANLSLNGMASQPPLPPERHDLIREVATQDNCPDKADYLDRLDQMLGILADAYRFARLNVLHAT